jgi:GNAT superfamily N-acetyltransferase
VSARAVPAVPDVLSRNERASPLLESDAHLIAEQTHIGKIDAMTWQLDRDSDERREDELTYHLVEHNRAASEAIRRRFERGNLEARPVQAFAVDDSAQLIGGCLGSTVDVWQWLTVDVMWVEPSRRGLGIGRDLLADVEKQARERGCRWAKLNTWEFQAPEFYEHLGYVVYGREIDYPPGHVNHLMRKDL